MRVDLFDFDLPEDRIALRPAEEFRPVHERLHDVGDAAPTQEADEPELELLRQAVPVFDRGQRKVLCAKPGQAVTLGAKERSPSA